MPLISTDNLHVFRGLQHIIRGVSVEISNGCCLQVMGANGAGKTTLLRTIAGLLEPESGRVLWRGRDTRDDLRAFHEQLGFLGHEAPLKGDLTALENLQFAVGIRRHVGLAECRDVLDRVDALPFADRLTRTLSAGQRRRVAFAGLLLTRTQLWLLDEPQTNLDAAGQGLVLSILREHLTTGGAVIAAVHQEFALEPALLQRLVLGASR